MCMRVEPDYLIILVQDFHVVNGLHASNQGRQMVVFFAEIVFEYIQDRRINQHGMSADIVVQIDELFLELDPFLQKGVFRFPDDTIRLHVFFRASV